MIEPEPDVPDTGLYYGDPDDEPEYNPDFSDEDFEVRICTDETIPDATGIIGTPEILGAVFE